MTSERTVEKVTKMAPVGVRSNGVLQFRGHLNREGWGNFEGHGFVGWGRKSRPAVVLSSRIFSAVCTRIGSRVFPRQIGEGKKMVGPVPFPGLRRVDTPGGTVVVSSARAGTLPVDSRCSGPLQERVENAWSPRGRAFVPGKKTRLGLNQRRVTCRAHRVGTVIVEGRTDGN